MGIEWKEGAVCFAAFTQWDSDNDFSAAMDCEDFQLNTIKQGDYIEASELDTEQKYNDAVEVFVLHGFKWGDCAADEYKAFDEYQALTCCDDGIWKTNTDRWNKRKITLNQLMAIGELKRLEIEKSAPKITPDLTPDLASNQEVKMQKNKPVVAQVMIDLTERMEIGIKTYGEALRANNGRDALQDAYEEALDLACYLKQAMIERDSREVK